MAERAIYVHKSGVEEEVEIRQHHPECDAFTVSSARMTCFVYSSSHISTLELVAHPLPFDGH